MSYRVQKPCSVVLSARTGNDTSYCRVPGSGKAAEKRDHKDANPEYGVREVQEHEGQGGEVHEVQDQEGQGDEDRRAK